MAVTGDTAHQVQRDAALFAERLAALEKMPFGPEKEAEIKTTGRDIDQLIVSTLTKDELRARFGKIQKDVVDELKKRQKVELKTAVSTVTDYFGKPENKDAKHFVGVLPISANAKAVSEVINHFKNKDKERSVYVFGGSSAEGAVVHGVYVGTVSQRPISLVGNAWRPVVLTWK